MTSISLSREKKDYFLVIASDHWWNWQQPQDLWTAATCAAVTAPTFSSNDDDWFERCFRIDNIRKTSVWVRPWLRLLFINWSVSLLFDTFSDRLLCSAADSRKMEKKRNVVDQVGLGGCLGSAKCESVNAPRRHVYWLWVLSFNWEFGVIGFSYWLNRGYKGGGAGAWDGIKTFKSKNP